MNNHSIFSNFTTSLNRRESIWTFLIIALGCVSFWVLSRFTVDDAFITWRYGYNLVNAGIWNYNPINFDLTQSYTNPLLAVISVIPAALDIDVVYFFKIMSIFTLLVASYGFVRSLNSIGVITAIFIILMPASIIHAFAGLETFLFTSLLAAAFIVAYENKKYSAYGISVILFFIRPESWLLAFILPLYFNHQKQEIINIGESSLKLKSYLSTMLIIELSILSSIVILFLLINYYYFNLPLPNAFYVKSGRDFSFARFLVYLLYIIPALFIIKNKYFSAMCFIFFGAMALNYSRSELMMDYASRFTYHLVIPLSLVLNYIINKNEAKSPQEDEVENKGFSRMAFKYGRYFPLSLCILFSLLNLRASYGISLYYPKLLGAHGELGAALNTDIYPKKISISIADAGIVPYNSALVNFDYIGLGSKEVAQKGVSKFVLEKYSPAVVVLYADQFNKPFIGFNQAEMLGYIDDNKIRYLCSVKFDDHYYLSVYSNELLPSVEKVCDSSKIANSKIDYKDYFKTVLAAPWHFWRTH